ncbi:MAG: response regulator [Candidatus Latescibacteria bacterium]|nr:response regulator [Candidatus Latescibacterota bacterium]
MNTMQPIMLVEDDQVDAMTIRRALKEINVTNPIIHCRNGEEALEQLEADGDPPCIILLDLNMPKMNGIEFLKVVKERGDLKMIPVVVLTTSGEERDRVESFAYSVAGYMLKPVDYLQFVDTMRTINLYWTLSKLPA